MFRIFERSRMRANGTALTFFLLATGSIFPLVIFAVAQAVGTIQQEQRLTQNEAAETVRTISRALEAEIRRHIRTTELLAALPAFDADADPTLAPRVLERSARQNPEWISSLASSPGGTVYANSSQRAPHPVNEQESHDRAVQTGKAQIGRLALGRDGQWGLPIRAPIVRNGHVLGVVTAALRPDKIRKFLDVGDAPPQWILAVVDGYGDRVARNQADETYRGTRAQESALTAREQADEGMYETTLSEGGKAIGFYAKSATNGWSVHAAIPVEAYYAPVRRWGWIIASEAIAGLAIGTAFFFFLMKDIRRRRETLVLEEQMGRLESLGRLTGRIAHDFNNLMMIIQGASKMLRQKKSPEDLERYLGRIDAAIERGTNVTGELLLFARGGVVPSISTDLADCVAKNEELLRQATGPEIELQISITARESIAKVDPIQFDLAILNLASNARDAMPQGGKLKIEVTRDTAEDRIRVSVSDTGEGISEKQLPRIFEPFFTTKEMGRGSGLGLAQVYAFARQSGGQVQAQSAIGVGTCITIALPRHLGPVDESANGQAPAHTLNGRLVLLVDDDLDLRTTAVEYLRSLGACVSEASGADEALKLLEDATFKAVISDIMMPGTMDVLGLARAIRNKYPFIPVILISGFSPSIAAAMKEGWEVLGKPFNLEELARRTSASIEKRPR